MTDASKYEPRPSSTEVKGYDVELQPISPDATPRPTATEAEEDKAEPAKEEPITADKARVQLLLVSGKRKSFDFREETMVAEVKAWIYKNWPTEWSDEAPPNVHALRLLHMGKFLEDPATLADSKIRNGVATIVHLVVRQTPPPAAKRFALRSSKREDADSTPSSGCCSSCSIQ